MGPSTHETPQRVHNRLPSQSLIGPHWLAGLCSTLSPRRPGGEGRVRAADEPVHGGAYLTLPSLRDGSLSFLQGGEGRWSGSPCPRPSPVEQDGGLATVYVPRTAPRHKEVANGSR